MARTRTVRGADSAIKDESWLFLSWRVTATMWPSSFLVTTTSSVWGLEKRRWAAHQPTYADLTSGTMCHVVIPRPSIGVSSHSLNAGSGKDTRSLLLSLMFTS